MINQAISHISLYSLLSIATMASGQDAQPASTVAGNAGSDVQSTSLIAAVQRAIVKQTNAFRKSNQLDAVQRDEHLMQRTVFGHCAINQSNMADSTMVSRASRYLRVLDDKARWLSTTQG